MSIQLYDQEEVSKTVQEKFSKKAYSKESLIKSSLFIFASIATIFIFFIIIFLFALGGGFFQKVSFFDFIFGEKWLPSRDYFGAAPLILGTLLVTIGAMVIAIPLGLGTAIFIAEIAPPRISRFLKGAVEILSGIPSVVYGFFGIIVLNQFIRIFFNIPSGNTWLSGSIILAIMCLPTIVSVSEDAISAVPNHYREASLAIGATKWQTIIKVVLPISLSGIMTAIILGIGRALGETMAILMVTGNCAIIPDPITNIFSSIMTITASIGLEMGETPAGSIHREALFALGIILFLITLAVNTISNQILSRLNKRFQGISRKKRFKNLIFTQKLKENNFYLRLKHILNKNKHIITYSIVTIVIILIISAWIGWFNALLVALIFFSIIFVMRSISAKNKQKIWYSVVIFASIVVLFFVGIIIYYIVIKGLPAITLGFLTEFPSNLGREGGILPAIIGTLSLVGISVLFAVPIGVAAGIYLSEYSSKNSKISNLIRAGVDNLNGIPSIVFGLFGFAFFVVFCDFGISMLAGGLSLGLMILPTIIKTTEEAVKSIPQSFREGSLALGSTKWQSISKIILPAAIPGIVTGIVLCMGRAAGETAPILFTAVIFSQRKLPNSPLEPVMALTFHLFILSTDVPYADLQAAGTALVLLFLVLILYGIAFIVRNHYKRKKTW